MMEESRLREDPAPEMACVQLPAISKGRWLLISAFVFTTSDTNLPAENALLKMNAVSLIGKTPCDQECTLLGQFGGQS